MEAEQSKLVLKTLYENTVRINRDIFAYDPTFVVPPELKGESYVRMRDMLRNMQQNMKILIEETEKMGPVAAHKVILHFFQKGTDGCTINLPHQAKGVLTEFSAVSDFFMKPSRIFKLEDDYQYFKLRAEYILQSMYEQTRWWGDVKMQFKAFADLLGETVRLLQSDNPCILPDLSTGLGWMSVFLQRRPALFGGSSVFDDMDIHYQNVADFVVNYNRYIDFMSMLHKSLSLIVRTISPERMASIEQIATKNRYAYKTLLPLLPDDELRTALKMRKAQGPIMKKEPQWAGCEHVIDALLAKL